MLVVAVLVPVYTMYERLAIQKFLKLMYISKYSSIGGGIVGRVLEPVAVQVYKPLIVLTGCKYS